MRICVFLLLSFLCFLNCSNQGRGSEIGSNKDATAQATNVVANDNQNANAVDAVEGQTNSRKKPGNFRVDAFIDNELVSRSTYHNGLCVRYITFNTQTKKQEGETEYFYKKSGELDRVKVIQGDKSRDAQLEAEKSNQDSLFQYNLLQSKGIEFPLPDIVPSEVSDISYIFSVADNYSDYTKDIQADGNLKVIKFSGFNKGIGYERATMNFRSGGLPILVKDYELTLENSFPTKETIKTDEGELTKTYSYKDGRLIGIVYQFIDLENQTNTLEKRFEYHELNQKP